MTITLAIDPSVESVGIQTIAKALGVTGTDEQCRVHLANHLRTVVANLYVRGDQLKRTEQADSAATTAAATKITVT